MTGGAKDMWQQAHNIALFNQSQFGRGKNEDEGDKGGRKLESTERLGPWIHPSSERVDGKIR